MSVEVAQGAHNVLTGGSYGSKDVCRIKEQADHSLPYLVAAALLDGEMTPRQFTPERINRADVQALLGKVGVRPSSAFTKRISDKMPCKLTVATNDGAMLEAQRSDYDGFHTRPMS